MSEENKVNEEVNEQENAQEVIENTVSEEVEAVEEIISEEEVDAGVFGEETEAEIVLDEEIAKEEPKKKNTALIVSVAVAVVIVAAAVVLYALGYFGMWFNKYNREYIDTTGRTIEEVAENAGMTLDEFIEEFELPKRMPKNTYESAAFYNMPASKIAEIYGMTFDTLKEQLELPDETQETDVWGKVEGEMTIRQYVGEENLEDFKAAYGFGDEVTLDTKWKEVRTVVDAKQKESREEAESEAQAMASEAPVADAEAVEGAGETANADAATEVEVDATELPDAE